MAWWSTFALMLLQPNAVWIIMFFHWWRSNSVHYSIPRPQPFWWPEEKNPTSLSGSFLYHTPSTILFLHHTLSTTTFIRPMHHQSCISWPIGNCHLLLRMLYELKAYLPPHMSSPLAVLHNILTVLEIIMFLRGFAVKAFLCGSAICTFLHAPPYITTFLCQLVTTIFSISFSFFFKSLGNTKNLSLAPYFLLYWFEHPLRNSGQNNTSVMP